MPDTPAAFAEHYLSLRVTLIPSTPGEPPGTVPVSARNYRNNGHRDTKGSGRAMHRFLAALANRGGVEGLREAGGAISYNGPAGSVQPRPLHDILQPFDGKGSSTLFNDVLKFAALWIARDSHQRARTPTLQDFADAYIGLDCIGFVRAYFLSEFPGSAGTQHASISAFRERGFNKRMSLGEVRQFDVMLPATGNAHIALISSVGNPRRDSRGRVTRIECEFAQSAGEATPRRPHNGIQHGPPAQVTVTPQDGVFHSAHTPDAWHGMNFYAVDGVPVQPVPHSGLGSSG